MVLLVAISRDKNMIYCTFHILFIFSALFLLGCEAIGPLTPEAGCPVSKVSVSASQDHTCVRKGPRALCFGFGDKGRLGVGNQDTLGDDPNEVSLLAPLVFDSAFETVVQVSAGEKHSCALSNLGHVRCWGLGTFGRLGTGGEDNIGDAGSVATLPAIQFANLFEDRAVQVSAGKVSTCVLFASGGVRCFGSGARGRLGSGSTFNIGDTGGPSAMTTVAYIPFAQPAIRATQVSVSKSTHHTCVLFQNGGVRCFGFHKIGFLGAGITDTDIGDIPGEMENLDFLPFPTPTIPAVQVSAGASNTCFLFANGKARCVGTTNDGIPGDVDGDKFIIFSDEERMTMISAGSDSACALFANGKVQW